MQHKIIFINDKFKLGKLRRLTKLPRRNKGLIAQGGGVKAFITLLAYLHTFEKHKYNPWKLLSGTSISSLVFSLYLSKSLKNENNVQDMIEAIPAYVRTSNSLYLKTLWASFIGRTSSSPVFDIDGLVEDCYSSDFIKPKLILKSDPDLFTTLTEAKTGNGVLIDVKDFLKKNTEDEFLSLLKASMNFPILGSKYRYLKNNYYVDGGISYPLPYQASLNKIRDIGNLLFVLSDSYNFTRKPLDAISRFLLKSVYGDNSRLVKKIFLVDKIHNDAQAFIRTLNELEIVSSLYTAENSEVGLLTTDIDILFSEYEASRNVALHFLRGINYLK